jgi:hypothetical protein
MCLTPDDVTCQSWRGFYITCTQYEIYGDLYLSEEFLTFKFAINIYSAEFFK